MCVCVICLVVSDSLQPHRPQPTRPLCPWDSPGKNTGVGCHFLLQKKLQKEIKWSHLVVSDSLQPHRPQPTRPLRPRDSPAKNTGVGYHFLLLKEHDITPNLGLLDFWTAGIPAAAFFWDIRSLGSHWHHRSLGTWIPPPWECCYRVRSCEGWAA